MFSSISKFKNKTYIQCKAYQPEHIGKDMARDVDGQKILLNSLLGDRIAIPDYQREYVWKRNIINKLLEDLIKHSKLSTRSSLSILFRLTYARSEGGNKPPNVTDGQQRLTALTCISAAIRDQLLIEGEYEKALGVSW